jgi:ferredoxin
MQVRINRHECCGNAQCCEIAPEVFALDSRQKAVVLDAEAAPLAVLIEAAEACPCTAITIEDDDGNPVFP